MAAQNSTTIIGGKTNFWLHSKGSGYDLTHPPTLTSPPIHPRLHLTTSKQPITLDPAKTALIPIDMQNYFLSPSLGRPSRSVGLDVVDNLTRLAIPACRKAGIRIAWLCFGLKDKDVEGMPPMMVATTGRDTNFEGGEGGGEFGAELGMVTLEDGREVDAGRALVRGQWNTELYGELEGLREEGDLWLHKDRLSGFWRGVGNVEVLRREGVRTLIFAGANLDQCVLASLLDAFHEGFDVVLLSDGAATTSPEFATECVQWNCELGWGFLVSCEALRKGVEEMLEHQLPSSSR